jgi:hypothetical protein
MTIYLVSLVNSDDDRTTSHLFYTHAKELAEALADEYETYLRHVEGLLEETFSGPDYKKNMENYSNVLDENPAPFRLMGRTLEDIFNTEPTIEVSVVDEFKVGLR